MLKTMAVIAIHECVMMGVAVVTVQGVAVVTLTVTRGCNGRKVGFPW